MNEWLQQNFTWIMIKCMILDKYALFIVTKYKKKFYFNILQWFTVILMLSWWLGLVWFEITIITDLEKLNTNT